MDAVTPVPLCFLAGAGQTARDWAAVIAALPPDVPAFAVDLAADPDFSIPGAAGELVRELDARGLGAVHLCGLSLGAMVALQCALDAPERLRSLIVSAGQVRPNPALMAVQSAVLRVLPERVVAGGGVDKATLLRLLAAAAAVDFRDRLGEIAVPALVLCGGRDRANLPAARRLAQGLRGSRLQIVPDAGHTWNVTHPELFAGVVADFVRTPPKLP